jgi:hypothetical protein
MPTNNPKNPRTEDQQKNQKPNQNQAGKQGRGGHTTPENQHTKRS